MELLERCTRCTGRLRTELCWEEGFLEGMVLVLVMWMSSKFGGMLEDFKKEGNSSPSATVYHSRSSSLLDRRCL